MTDAILAPGATIAAFAMAVISWYAMLRNGMTQLYTDFHAAQDAEVDIAFISQQCESQRKQCREWQEQWMIWGDKTPDSLYIKLWGASDSERIKHLLRRMNQDTARAESFLQKWIDVEEIKNHKMKRFTKTLYKVSYVLIKKHHLEGLLKRHGSYLRQIEETATRGWRRVNPGYSDDLIPDTVRNIGVGHLLLPLTLDFQRDVDALARTFLAAQDAYHVELELDLFSSDKLDSTSGDMQAQLSFSDPQNRHARRVAATAYPESFTLQFLVQKKKRPNAFFVRLEVQRCAAQQETNTVDGAVEAFDQLLFYQRDECILRTTKGSYFKVRRSGRPPDHNNTAREAYRSLFSAQASLNHPALDDLHQISKYKAVFELSQACFIFLRSRWFSQLCSCNLRLVIVERQESNVVNAEKEDEFALYVNENHSTRPEIPGNPLWCMRDTWDPLRRLGILLTEITLGTAVSRIVSNGDDIITGLEFHQGEPPQAQICKIEDLRAWLAGEDNTNEGISRSSKYADAIIHCLITKLRPNPPAKEMERDLCEYYWKVVVELKSYYHSLRERYERQLRRHNAISPWPQTKSGDGH